MNHFTVKAMPVILALVLYGAAPRAGILSVIAVIIGWRLKAIIQHGFPSPLTADGLTLVTKSTVKELEDLPEEERQKLIKRLKLHSFSDNQKIAEAIVRKKQCDNLGRRFQSKLELPLLLISFILSPFLVTLFVSDIVVLDDREEWGVVLLLASVALLHFGLLKLAEQKQTISNFILVAWGSFCLISIPIQITEKHPYLNPWAPNSNQLFADHVLKIKNNVVAEKHVEYVFAYAKELQQAGQLTVALKYYIAGLYLDAENSKAHLSTAEIYKKLGKIQLAKQHEEASRSIATGERSVAFSIKENSDPLPTVSEINTNDYTVLIVPVGDVDTSLLNAAGQLVKNSLGHPVLLSQQHLPLPPSDRKRGLLSGQQRLTHTIHDAFWRDPPIDNSGPIQVVLVTEMDVYMENTNFVFATSFRNDFSCVVSYNRFRSEKREATISRLAKQILSSTIKAIRVPQANTLDCVTAYVNSLDQSDRKSIQLSAPTRNMYENHIRQFTALSR